MTLVCKAGGFRIHVFPDDHPPPHVHVATDRAFMVLGVSELSGAHEDPPQEAMGRYDDAGQRRVFPRHIPGRAAG